MKPPLRQIEEWIGHRPPRGAVIPWIRILLAFILALAIVICLD